MNGAVSNMQLTILKTHARTHRPTHTLPLLWIIYYCRNGLN